MQRTTLGGPWHLFVLACLLPATPGCHRNGDEPIFELRQEEWSFQRAPGVHLTTDHFDIYTTLDNRRMQEYLPLFLESVYRQYARLLPPPDSDRRLQTYLFANQYQWRDFVRRRFPGRHEFLTSVQVGGFATGDMCVAYYRRPTAYTLAVIAHEGMHQYFGTYFDQRIPAWLNEGLACYCEGFDLRRDRPVFEPEHNTFRINRLREALANDTLLPLQHLLDTNAGSVILQSQAQLTSAYYAQAWALVVFLRHGGEDSSARQFDEMLADVAGGRLQERAQATRITSEQPGRMSFGEAVFRTYITEDLATFEEQYREYLLRLADF